MAGRRRYTRADRITAIVAADMTTPDDAANATGIPVRNIYRWRDDPALAEYVTKTRDAMADEIRVAASLAWSLLIERIAKGEIETRDLIILAGVAVDKSQLLTGGATSRTEARDITGTLTDADLITALRSADAIASPGRAAPEAAEPAEG